MANIPRSYLIGAGVVIIVIILLAAGIFLLSGKGQSDGGNTPADGNKTLFQIRYLSSPTFTGDATINVAKARGYFAEQGIDLVSVGSSIGLTDVQTISSLTSGQIDVNHDSLGPLIQAISQGIKIKLVVPHTTTEQRNVTGTAVPNGGLLVLKNSSIYSANDLKGKKIAVAALGGLPDYSLREYLKKSGLSLSDVQELVVPYQNFYQALESHQVDAIYLWQDNFYYDLAQGDVRIVYQEKDTVGNTICGGYVFTNDFIAQHPDVVKGFVAAIVKAWDWEDQHPQEFRQIANDWYVAHNIDPAASAYITTSGTRPHALIEDIDFTTYEDFLVQDNKVRKGQVKASDVYTNEFNPYYKK